jgi:predicted site-specific integrase-resolvase
MKLSKWAKKHNITYKSAWDMYKKGLLKDISYELPTGAIHIKENEAISEIKSDIKIVTYARVSSSENKNNLESQSERLQKYCLAKGYKIYKNYKEIGSGLNDKRKILESILNDSSIIKIVVEHKDRFSRFGFNYIQLLLKIQGREIEYINEPKNEKEDLITDFVSIITSFTARLYGLRRSKRKVVSMIEGLKNENN